MRRAERIHFDLRGSSGCPKSLTWTIQELFQDHRPRSGAWNRSCGGCEAAWGCLKAEFAVCDDGEGVFNVARGPTRGYNRGGRSHWRESRLHWDEKQILPNTVAGDSRGVSASARRRSGPTWPVSQSGRISVSAGGVPNEASLALQPELSMRGGAVFECRPSLFFFFSFSQSPAMRCVLFMPGPPASTYLQMDHRFQGFPGFSCSISIGENISDCDLRLDRPRLVHEVIRTALTSPLACRTSPQVLVLSR